MNMPLAPADSNSVSEGTLLPLLSPLPQNDDSASSSDQNSTMKQQNRSDGSVALALQTEEPNDDSRILAERRREIEHLLHRTLGSEGQLWYVIPHGFLKSFLYSSLTSWSSLASDLGPMDMTGIVDSQGGLYCEDNEPVPTYNVPPVVFHQLAKWFGTRGEPVTRPLMKNPASGAIEVERHPVVYVVHHLAKTAAPRNRYMSHHSNYSHPTTVAGSSHTPIRHLMATIRTRIKAEKLFRVWVIGLEAENAAGTPPSIPVPYFLRTVPFKKLVLPSMSDTTMASHSIQGHEMRLLVELAEKTTRSTRLIFPLDSFLANFDVASHSLAAIRGEARDGRGGTVGLANLGNTCYMNSALQCLLHVPEVNNYFFLNLYEKELNTTNALGFRGEVAQAFGLLLHRAFDPTSLNSSVSPRDFKYTIGHYSSMFLGYHQQDSQEFLSWLLDALHEDLNRILEKPYNEKPELSDDDLGNHQALVKLANMCWHQHKQRNDSVITDLFTGMYQSTLVCPDCGKTSVTFDPFNDLTLPLPIEKKWFHTLTVVDMAAPERPVRTLEVSLPKTATFDSLIQYLADFFRVPKHYFFVFELYNDAIIKNFQEEYLQLKFFPVNELMADDDDHYVYIVPHERDDTIVPVFSTVEDSDPSYRMVHPFGIPLFLVLRESEPADYALVERKVAELTRFLVVDDLEAEMDDENEPRYTLKYMDEVKMRHTFRMRPQRDTDSALLAPVTRLNFNRLPDLVERATLDEQKMFEQPQQSQAETESDYVIVENPKSPSKSPAKLLDDETDGDNFGHIGLLFDSTTTLPTPCEVSESESGSIDMTTSQPVAEDGLVTKHMVLVCQWRNAAFSRAFTSDKKSWTNKPSIRNEAVEASRLKAERQRRATVLLVECLRSFSTPEVLGEHDLWYCPRCKDHKRATKTIQIWTTGDLLTIHLKRFQSARSFSDKIDLTVDFPIEGLDMTEFVSGSEGAVYDLIAVDNHYGGLGGGHYTASVKNFRDGNWYYYNDSHVSPIDDVGQVVNGAAYLLFYRKRSSVGLGGEKLSGLFEEGSQKYEQEWKNLAQSVSGVEGQVTMYEEEEEERAERARLETEREDEPSGEEGQEFAPGGAQGSSGEQNDSETNSTHRPRQPASLVDDTNPLKSSDDETPNSNKKSRSPALENDPYFKGGEGHLQNKRKQRLISKLPEEDEFRVDESDLSG